MPLTILLAAAGIAVPTPTAAAARVDVVVEAGERGKAVPPKDWRPPHDPLFAFRLEHRRGEPLDADWVRRQFRLNGLDQAEPSRALALVQLVNRAFLSAGFVNSGLRVAPADPDRPGQLVLVLVQGRLVAPPGGRAMDVAWAGGRSAGLDDTYVRRRMKAAFREPLDAGAVEHDFRLLAEEPAIRTVDARLSPGSVPGEASLSLDLVPRERVDLYLGAANSRSPSVGGERIAVGGSVRNLVTGGDLISGEAGTTRGLFDATLSYATPFFDPRTSLSARFSLDRAAVIDAPLLPLDIKAREKSAEASLTRRVVAEPLMPAGEGRWSPSRSLSLGVGAIWRSQHSYLLGLPFSFAPGSVDGHADYVAARLLADYLQRSVDHVFALAATATLGIDGTRAAGPFALNPNRHFKALLVQANYARRLSTSGLELRARLTGQMSDAVLYSGERLSIGGAATVRGYRESLVLADRGVIGSVELARPFSLSGVPAGNRRFDWGAFTASFFVDAARAWNARAAQPVPNRLASIGPALAWQPGEALSLDVAWGIALTHAEVTGSRDIQDEGFHFRFTLRPLRLFGRGGKRDMDPPPR